MVGQRTQEQHTQAAAAVAGTLHAVAGAGYIFSVAMNKQLLMVARLCPSSCTTPATADSC
jgi:hypothetical protein